MTWEPLIVVLFRWVHILSACVLIGSIFFMTLLLPRALKELEPESRARILDRCGRGLKFVVHTLILLFLASGIFNAFRLWPGYKAGMPLTHALLGLHVLLALAVLTLLLMDLSGRSKVSIARLAVSLALLAGVVLAASSLKWARETANPGPATATTSPARPN